MGVDHSLLSELDREWRSVSPLPLPGWASTAGEALAALRADPDPVLGRLIGSAQGGDRLAGRVIVQALLPKLVKMAAVDARAELGDYLTQLWLRLATFPPQRRRSVAANLALDTLKAVKREQRGGDRLVAVESGWWERPGPAAERPDAADVLASASSLGLIDATTEVVLRLVYLEGLTSAEAGRRVGLSAEAVRWRCRRALRSMAREAPALAA